MAMAAMGRDDSVARTERRAHPDRDRLFADISMDDTVDLASAVIVRGAFLEAADRQHAAQHFTLRVGRQVWRNGFRRQALGREGHAGLPRLIAADGAD